MKIKPCPFCGGESLVYSHGSAIVRFFAKCSVCQVHTDTEMGPEQAADVWNSRVEKPSEADKWLAEATAQRDRADILQLTCDELAQALGQARRMLAYSGKLQ